MIEIINKAGGLTKNAIVTNINLSKKVIDEMVIYIPSNKDKPISCRKCQCPEIKVCKKESVITTTTKIPITSSVITTTIPTTTLVKIVNINTGTKEELISINGIGEVIAESIINYRKTNDFLYIEDLMLVKGIGEVLFAKIKSFITV